MISPKKKWGWIFFLLLFFNTQVKPQNATVTYGAFFYTLCSNNRYKILYFNLYRIHIPNTLYTCRESIAKKKHPNICCGE